MTLHLLKPALKVTDIHEFARRQQKWHMAYRDGTAFPVWTSRRPARMKELLDGGSVYWIVKKAIRVRQAIIGIEDYQEEEDEKPSYLIMCETKLVRTRAVPKKPFQGWRYLQPENTPPDTGPLHAEDETPPPEMERALRQAGLL